MNDIHSLAHSKWNCKYHIVFAPKYRRKTMFGAKGREIGAILRELCKWKGINIEDILKVLGIKGCIEGELPEGVSAHKRTDGTTTYLFVENYTQNEICNIPLDDTYEDMLTGEKTRLVHLKPYDICILKKSS